MRRIYSHIGTVASTFLVLVGLLLSLGHEYWSRIPLSIPLVTRMRGECSRFFEPGGYQWLAMLFLLIYLLVLAHWRYKMGEQAKPHYRSRYHTLSTQSTKKICELSTFACFVGLSVMAYFFSYKEAARSYEGVTLVGGITIGLGTSVWSQLRRCAIYNRVMIIFVVLISALTLASMWQAEMFQTFQYREQPRGSGAWSNPNTYGLLMGLGLMLSLGLIIGSRIGNIEHPRILKTKCVFFGILIATGLLTCGLIDSYSRGAWIGVVIGSIYLGLGAVSLKGQSTCLDGGSLNAGTSEEQDQCVLLHRNIITLTVASFAALVLAFWSFRYTERSIIRRVFSVGNWNDFSWRNRLATYEGSLQMMASHPWLGFGWNQPERVYRNLYQSRKLTEGSSFGLNEYFVIGTTLGLPCLLFFLAYIWLTFSRSERPFSGNAPGAAEQAWLQTTCRAGVIVLLVGFWFDGGLFKLALATPFWVLLELGRADGEGIEPKNGTSSLAAVS